MRKRNALGYLTEAIQCYRARKPVPSLLKLLISQIQIPCLVNFRYLESDPNFRSGTATRAHHVSDYHAAHELWNPVAESTFLLHQCPGP